MASKGNGVVSVNETLAKGLAKRVVQEITDYDCVVLNIADMPRRKRIREAIKSLKKYPFTVCLGSEHKETSKWELFFGEWSPTIAKVVTKGSALNELEYDKLGFSMDFDTPSGFKSKRFVVTLSKHAFERLILRRRPVIATHKEAVTFLNKIIKRVVLNCLAYVKNKGVNEDEFVIEVDGFVFPVVMNLGSNIEGKTCLAFVIKTVMPVGYEGAQNLLNKLPDYEVKQDIGDYWETLHKIHY